jgi:preprotein translocase subunit SecG
MTTLLIIVHVLVCLFLIGIVLLQHGKGADIGATFGGSSQSLFGSEGPVPLLNKITTFSAIIFMGTSVSLAYLSANRSTGTVMSELKPVPVEQTVPAPETAPVTIPLPAAQQAETKQAQETAQAEATAPEQPVKKEQNEGSKQEQE